jgi:hypothetical protein
VAVVAVVALVADVALVAVAALPPIFKDAAVPVRLVPAPENVVAVAVPDTPRLVNPLAVPPVIATALAFCVDIVPKAPVAAVTKAVVASCVVFVPGEAVGARGVPVKVGLAKSALVAIAVAMSLNSVSISVPLTIFNGFPLIKLSLLAKFVDLV